MGGGPSNTSSSSTSSDSPSLIALSSIILILTSFLPYVSATPYLWQTLPPTPTLPPPSTTGFVNISDGARIWYATYNPPSRSTSPPLLFLHGGGANSNYWAHQINSILSSSSPALKDRSVLAIDTRGHGRSYDATNVPFSYDLFTTDVIAVLNHLSIPKVAVIGWSDGAITGFDLAMNYTSRIDRLFAFAGSYSASNADPTAVTNAVFVEYLTRAAAEYLQLSPTPLRFVEFEGKLEALWGSLPVWDGGSFGGIKSVAEGGPMVRIVDADYDELVLRTTPLELQGFISGSERSILPGVSHFAMLQDPKSFSYALERFLEVGDERTAPQQ